MMIIDMNTTTGIRGILNIDDDYNYLFSIVIPVYNEEKIILESLKKLKKFKLNKCLFNIIFVNDGSTDKTLSYLKKNKSKNFHIKTHKHNQGYGSALKTGISYAVDIKSKYVLFIDSDMTNDLNDIISFKNYMWQNYDLIKASRYCGSFNESKIPFKRFIFSYIGNKLYNLRFNQRISDATNGFRAVKLDHYKDIDLKEEGFSIIVEELFKFKNLDNFKIANIPVKLGSRNEEISKSSFKYDIKTIFSYLKFLLKIYK